MNTKAGVKLAFVTVAALLATTGTATAADWQYYDNDADNWYDIAAIDRDDSGEFDDVRFDLDNDSHWDTRMFNKSGTSGWLLEYLDFDMDENNEVEARLQDGDQRVGFDYLLVDRDQNGYWDRTRGYARRIIPRSNVDAVTRSNRQNASSRMIYNYRQQTGMSLLYPSLPGGY